MRKAYTQRSRIQTPLALDNNAIVNGHLGVLMLARHAMAPRSARMRGWLLTTLLFLSIFPDLFMIMFC